MTKLSCRLYGLTVVLHSGACARLVVGADAPDSSTAIADVHADETNTTNWDSGTRFDADELNDSSVADAVEIADRPVILQPPRFARLDLIRTPRGSNEIDSVEAWIVVPQRPDGTGYRVDRSGECVVENLTYPTFDRFAERLIFSIGATEREVGYRDINQTMRWTERGYPFMGVVDVSFRAVRPDFAMPWTFTARIPPPVLNFTSPPGIEQLPMPNLFYRLTDTIAFRWTPAPTSPLVQIQFQTYIVNPAPLPYSVSTLRCIYDGRLGTAAIRLADHPAWRRPDNFRSGIVLDVDALEQHLVPYGDIMVEVNMMHRYGAFAFTLQP